MSETQDGLFSPASGRAIFTATSPELAPPLGRALGSEAAWQWRADPAVPLRHCVTVTSLGELTLVAQGSALTGIYFQNLGGYQPGIWVGPHDSVLDEAAHQIHQYLRGQRREFDLEIALPATDFARKVWEITATIPYGQVVTYGDIGKRLGSVGYARAVGVALNRNPLPLIIPCHRVIGAQGRLTGYAGGVERKQLLLDLEANHAVPGATLF